MAAISIYPNLLSVASLELGQSYDSPSTSEVTLGDMGKIGRDLSTTKTANLNGVRIFFICIASFAGPNPQIFVAVNNDDDNDNNDNDNQ